MGNSTQKSSEKSDKSWIFILLFLVGLGFLFIADNASKSVSSKASNPANNPEHLKRVDTHLKGTAYDLEVEKRQAKIDYLKQLNQYHKSDSQSAYKESPDFSLESDPQMQTLTQELNRSQGARQDLSPEEIVQNRLYENEQLQKESEAYREAYAQAFIENARRAGWAVELGPNFEVLSVKKIRENRGPSLFDQGGSNLSR